MSSVFQITCQCPDEKVGIVLRLLADQRVLNLEHHPLHNAKINGRGKHKQVVSTAPDTGSLYGNVRALIEQDNITQFTMPELRDIIKRAGGKKTSDNYIIKQLRQHKAIKSMGMRKPWKVLKTK